MAIKVKKRETRAEVAKAPDTIYTQGSSLFNWLETHRKTVLIGVVVVLLLIAIVATIVSQMAKGTVHEGAALTEAVLISAAPVGAEAEGERTYETRAARAEAVRTALAEPLEADEPSAAAAMLDAAASMELADLPRAQQRYEAVAMQDDLPILSSVAIQGWAATQAEAGELDAAQGTLDQLAERAEALSDYVEIEKARLAEAAGELELARTLYAGVAERAGNGLPAILGGGGLAEIARHRASVLAMLSGAAPTPEAPAPDGPAPNEGTGN